MKKTKKPALYWRPEQQPQHNAYRDLKRFDKLLAALGSGILVVLALASPASAVFYDPADSIDPPTNSRIAVDSKAHINRDGSAVDWTIKFTCPRGDQYILTTILEELNPPQIPDLSGEDYGIGARGTTSGTCTGRSTTVRTRSFVFDTVWTDRTTFEIHTEYFPIAPTRAPQTVAAAVLQDATNSFPGDFFAQYCAASACASENGPRIDLR